MSKRNIIIASIVVSIIIAGSISYFLFQKYENESIEKNQVINESGKETIDDNGIIYTTSKEDVVLLPNAKIIIKQFYKKCGHTVKEELSVPEEIVNMNESEAKKYYFGWEIEEFLPTEIVIYKENIDICEEHYIVKDVDGIVNVYRKNDKNEEILVTATDIITKYLPAEDCEKLRNGISIIGKENLSVLLEDYE